MATVDAVTPRAYAAAPRRGWLSRLLEDERWLASTLLMPTVVLLGLFIAYPFVMGVWLSVTDTKVGVAGQFVGFANFAKLWSDDIFRVAVYNTCLYTFVTTVVKLVLGLWLALLLNRDFRGKAFTRAFILLPFIILTLGVLYFLINGLMLKLASEFVPGFRVNGCLPAVLGSILLSIVDYLLNRLAGI